MKFYNLQMLTEFIGGIYVFMSSAMLAICGYFIKLQWQTSIYNVIADDKAGKNEDESP